MPMLIDLNFHSNSGFKDISEILEKQKPALQFSKYLKNEMLFIKHADIEDTCTLEHINYIFFKRRNGLFSIPVKTLKYLRKQESKIILVQGFIFPFQLILLKIFLPKKTKIIVQHHGELPFTGIKRLLQKLSLKQIDACLFTSIENSIIWKKKKIIPSNCPCFEVLEASTDFKWLNKKEDLKKELGMAGQFNYLWVGRLNSNKDPLTVIRAFSEYHKLNSDAKLFMIYQDDALLPNINEYIVNKNLSSVIHLIGKIPHQVLEKWFNGAEYYISGSHKEGSGYALIEAMACGCIPIVTNIPSFCKITDTGNFGLLYEAGNENDLLLKLKQASEIDPNTLNKKIVEHFNSKLSYASIARDLDKVCNLLLN
jgi:Glycosyltransferase